MKKVVLSVCILALAFSFAFAQQAPVAAPRPAKETAGAPELKVTTGKVKQVTLADAQKGTKSELVVVGDNGKEETFLVKSTTTIYDADWKAGGLDKIKQDDKVKVKYTTNAEGVMEASSVAVVK